jgi:hypothetical protein
MLWVLGQGRMVSSWAHFIPRKTDTECLPCTRGRETPAPFDAFRRWILRIPRGPHIGVYTELRSRAAADQAFPAHLPNFDLLISLKAAMRSTSQSPPLRNRHIFCKRMLLHMLTAVPGRAEDLGRSATGPGG